MKVLVVGGAGYLGSVLVREMLDRGYAVKVFDRMYYGNIGLAGVRDRIELEIGDIRTMGTTVLDDVDAVINLAGLSNDPTAEYNPSANYEMNTAATRDLAVLCKRRGIKRFIFASSASIYDIGVGNEDKDVLLDEETEVNPRAAYSGSKFQAERILLEMTDKDFAPVMLRMGTLFGFSPRMRYDLVVNTFTKDAFTKGKMTMYFGGEMWRPLCDVRDAARAYLACLNADLKDISGQIFNVSTANYRISELALRVREGLRLAGMDAEINPEYVYKGVRSYRISNKKIHRMLGYSPSITVEESVRDIVNSIKQYGYTDFDNARYYNIAWMKTLEEAHEIIKITNSVFGTGAVATPLELGAPVKAGL